MIITQIKPQFGAILLDSDVALDILKETELIRIANRPTCYDLPIILGHLDALSQIVHRHVHRMSAEAYKSLEGELSAFRKSSAARYHHGSCLDWYFRYAQATIANAAGFPDRASWSSYLVEHMGVTASI